MPSDGSEYDQGCTRLIQCYEPEPVMSAMDRKRTLGCWRCPGGGRIGRSQCRWAKAPRTVDIALFRQLLETFRHFAMCPWGWKSQFFALRQSKRRHARYCRSRRPRPIALRSLRTPTGNQKEPCSGPGAHRPIYLASLRRLIRAGKRTLGRASESGVAPITSDEERHDIRQRELPDNWPTAR